MAFSAEKTAARCPKCSEPYFPVVHNDISRDGMAIYRKRECQKCFYWISTEERLVNHKRNKHEQRLVEVYRKLNHAKRKALWNVLKLMR